MVYPKTPSKRVKISSDTPIKQNKYISQKDDNLMEVSLS